MNTKRIAAVSAAVLAAGLLGSAGVAQATPGQYTYGGDVLVTVAVSEGSCATITWPKGTTSVTCGVEQVTHHDIVPGDRFGASIVSHTGGGVACRVLDVESLDVIHEDSAAPGYTADCLRTATP